MNIYIFSPFLGRGGGRALFSRALPPALFFFFSWPYFSLLNLHLFCLYLHHQPISVLCVLFTHISDVCAS